MDTDADNWVLVDNKDLPADQLQHPPIQVVDNEDLPADQPPEQPLIQNDQVEEMADNPQQIIDESDSINQPQLLVPNSNGLTQNECFTAWELIKLRQEWNVQNFARAMELSSPGVCLRSCNFSDASMPYILWQLCLYPGGKREENIGNVSLFLRMSTTAPVQKEFTVRAEYRYYFVDDTGIAKFSNVNTGDFKVKPSKGSHSWGLRNIPRQKVLQTIRQDGSLHIVCEIEILPNLNKLQPHLRQDCQFVPKKIYNLSLEQENNMIGAPIQNEESEPEPEPPFIEIRPQHPQNHSLPLAEFVGIIEEFGKVVNMLIYCPNGTGHRSRHVMPVLPPQPDIDRFSGRGEELVVDVAYDLRKHGKRQASHGIYVR